jgi:hypothetical protein
MPFRVLAAVVGITGGIAIGGTSLMMWRGALAPTVGNIVMLPLTAWFIRLMYHAAVYGQTPQGGECWPFASSGVWNCYVFLVLAYWVFKL